MKLIPYENAILGSCDSDVPNGVSSNNFPMTPLSFEFESGHQTSTFMYKVLEWCNNTNDDSSVFWHSLHHAMPGKEVKLWFEKKTLKTLFLLINE